MSLTTYANDSRSTIEPLFACLIPQVIQEYTFTGLLPAVETDGDFLDVIRK
jgi:hypothetical protein